MSDHIPGVFDELLQRQHLLPAFQPIIDLATMATVAVEALARWPHLDVAPDVAFQQAKELGRLDELDSACRNAAVDDALEHGLPDGFALFVNLEPSTISAESARQLVARTKGQITIVAEITERALTTRPAELLEAVRALRGANCAVALDDVGAVPESLALLPFISPSVVKLDISLIQRWPEVEQGAILTAVSAHAERTGALILAEGVETERHLEQALALGAAGSPRRLRATHRISLQTSTGASSSAFSIRGRGFFGDTHWPKGPSSRHFTTPGEPGLVLGNSSRRGECLSER
jgi:EAL domain-containing protein (putative c-di-GMP-specific phosphodiesterase class I)